MKRETILIVDDDPVNLMTVRRFIRKRMSFDILEAVDGQSALDIAQSDPGLALILLDVNMPDISGIEVCRILKNNPRTRAVPIILISAVHTDDTSIDEGLQAGADGYITKPVAENMLHAWLNAAMRINSLNRALADRQGHAPEDVAGLIAKFSKLSHNVNNPLQAIMAAGDLLDMEHGNDDGIQQSVQLIQENADKIANLVGEASQLARAFHTAQERD
jgi:CheY-like chemotaxis protein